MNKFKAFGNESGANFFNVLKALCFPAYAQETAVYSLCVAVFVMYGNNVAAASCDNTRNRFELTGFVYKLNNNGAGSAALVQTTVYNAGKYGNIDVAAGNKADYLFTLNGNFAEFDSRNGNRARSLRRKLLVFNEVLPQISRLRKPLLLHQRIFYNIQTYLHRDI